MLKTGNQLQMSEGLCNQRPSSEGSVPPSNTEEGKRTQVDPCESNFIFCPNCKPSVSYSMHRSITETITGRYLNHEIP